MKKAMNPHRRVFPAICRVVLWLAACGLTAPVAGADWLVTRAGERVETEGSWQIKGRMVVFTQPGGTLASLRLSEVDLEASRQATTEAADAAEATAAATPPMPSSAPAPRRPARVITNADVGEGVLGAEGAELLVERLRQAHRFKDVGLAMGLVNLQDVPEGMRSYIQTQFEWMMERRIRDVRFVEAEPPDDEFEEPADDELALVDDVLYEPNVEVAGKLVVDFFPDPDQQELSITFLVGTRLGSYFIAAPREAAQ
jgi:hypothetical protein